MFTNDVYMYMFFLSFLQRVSDCLFFDKRDDSRFGKSSSIRDYVSMNLLYDNYTQT